MAHYVSLKSKDRSTKNGCVIVGVNHQVLSTGYNGPPRGVDDTQEFLHVRPEKYLWFEHAERNSTFNAAMHGISLIEATAYVTAMPCADCARALIQSGVRRVVIPKKSVMLDSEKVARWETQWRAARMLFQECGVVLDVVEDDSWRAIFADE